MIGIPVLARTRRETGQAYDQCESSGTPLWGAVPAAWSYDTLCCEILSASVANVGPLQINVGEPGDDRRASSTDTEHFDVLIAGAGISGIGAAYHLKSQTPGKSFVILESLESFGGTWLTHKYPGIRSDSDLYTFGSRFKPWTGQPIAAADKILTYMQEVIDENDITPHIRYHHTILSASWSSQDKRWTIAARRSDTGETVQITANFLWMCQGYYDHSRGFTPEWEGMDDFKGRIVHPQTWPEDLDYKGKRVIVIGSGATAATLVPAIAADCQHVTLLQRSPTYIVSPQGSVRPERVHTPRRGGIRRREGRTAGRCA